MGEEIKFFGKVFWDLWLQKIFRNIASMKFQWLLLLYIPIVWGMFQGQWIDGKWVSKIPAITGCGLLGGGFVTLALGRIWAQTKLKEEDDRMNDIMGVQRIDVKHVSGSGSRRSGKTTTIIEDDPDL